MALQKSLGCFLKWCILSNTLGWILLDNPGPPPQPITLTSKVTDSQMLYIKLACKYKYNLTAFVNCIGTFTAPTLGKVLSWPLYYGACNVPPQAHTQLQGKPPVRSLQSNPQPFNDRKLSGSLSSAALNCVFACVCVQTHLGTLSIELVIIRYADDDILTPRLQEWKTHLVLKSYFNKKLFINECLYGGAWNLI